MGSFIGTNEIVIFDKHAEVILYDRSRKEKCRVLIDIDDVELISKYRWYDSRGYASSTQIGQNKKAYNLRMHRLIMDAPSEFVVDHIDGNTLNNRKANLRLCTREQNSMNTISVKLTNHKTPGVRFVDGWYRVCIKIKNKNTAIASIKDFEYAKIVRLKAELIVQGEFSPNVDKYCLLDDYPEFSNINTIHDLKKYFNCYTDKGDKHHLSKLTNKDIEEIRKMYEKTKPKEICEKYNISKTTFYRVIRDKK